MAGVLLTAFDPDAATTNVVFTALFVVCAGVILALTAASWWIHHNARLLGLPLDLPDTTPATLP